MHLRTFVFHLLNFSSPNQLKTTSILYLRSTELGSSIYYKTVTKKYSLNKQLEFKVAYCFSNVKNSMSQN